MTAAGAHLCLAQTILFRFCFGRLAPCAAIEMDLFALVHSVPWAQRPRLCDEFQAHTWRLTLMSSSEGLAAQTTGSTVFHVHTCALGRPKASPHRETRLSSIDVKGVAQNQFRYPKKPCFCACSLRLSAYCWLASPILVRMNQSCALVKT